MEAIVGNSPNSTWHALDYFFKVIPSFREPDRFIYVHAARMGDGKFSLHKFDKLEGNYQNIAPDVMYFTLVAHITDDNSVHDVLYYATDSTCTFYKYNETNNSTTKIAGNGVCDTNCNAREKQYNESLCRGYLMSYPHKFNNESELSFYLYGGQEIYRLKNNLVQIVAGHGKSTSLEDQPATNVTLGISGTCTNSLGEIYILQNYREGTGYYIRKIYPNGIITTVLSLMGNYAYSGTCLFDSTVYEVENKKMVLDRLYIYEHPASTVTKFELTFEYPNTGKPTLLNYSQTTLIGKYNSFVQAGDGGKAIDGRISTVNVDAFDGFVALSALGNVRFIDNQTGIISEVLSAKGHGFYTAINNFKFIPKDIIYSYNEGNPEIHIADHVSSSVLKYSLKSKSMEPMKKYFISDLNNAPSTAKPYSMALDSYSNLLVSNDLSYWSPNFLINITKLGPKVIFGQNKKIDDSISLDSSILGRPYSSFFIMYNQVYYSIVSDRGNNRLLLIDFDGRNITTIASMKDGINGPTGICYLSDRSMVIFSDTGNHVLRYYNIRTRELGIFAGRLGMKGFTEGSLLNATFNQVSFKMKPN